MLRQLKIKYYISSQFGSLNMFSFVYLIGMNDQVHPDEANLRAQHRQTEFNKMEERLRQMDMSQFQTSPRRF